MSAGPSATNDAVAAAIESIKQPFRAEPGTPRWPGALGRERARILGLLDRMAGDIDDASYLLQGVKLRAGTGHGPDDATESLQRLAENFALLFPPAPPETKLL